MKRRELLAGMAALGVAGPVPARPLMPLHDKPREMLSPPFVDGDGRDLTLEDATADRELLDEVFDLYECFSHRRSRPPQCLSPGRASTALRGPV